MYQRLKACLLFPKRLANYINDRIGIMLIYLLIFSLLYMLPFISIIGNINGSVKSMFREGLNKCELIEYRIEDGQLVDIYGNNKSHYIKLSTTDEQMYNSYLVIGSTIDLNQIGLNEIVLIIQMDKDGIYLLTTQIDQKIKLMDYDKDVDLSKIYEDDHQTFVDVLSYIDTYLDTNKGIIYGVGIPILFIYSVIQILITALMSSVILFLVYAKYQIKFRYMYKLALYSQLPTIIGFLFSIIFGGTIGSLFNNLGFIISTIYVVIALNQVIRKNIIQQIEEQEGKDHESI